MKTIYWRFTSALKIPFFRPALFGRATLVPYKWQIKLVHVSFHEKLLQERCLVSGADKKDLREYEPLITQIRPQRELLVSVPRYTNKGYSKKKR